MIRKKIIILVTALACVSIVGAAPKVLIIDSYHEGYAWSDGIVKGATGVLKPAGLEYKVERMDTKRNPSEEFKKQSALKIKAAIDAYAPDVIIAADDNASKYVIVPNYKDKTIPVIFCGVNWDASGYGFPCSNVTGMLEVYPVNVLLENLKPYAKGNRIGFISSNNETSKKDAENSEKAYGITMEKVYVTTVADWKKSFLALQKTSDIIVIDNNAGINDWIDADIEKFVLENTVVPTGVMYDWMSHFGMVGIVKSPEEQGEWAANAAVKVTKGEKVSSIPVAKNQKADIYLNMKIAQKLGVTLDFKLVKKAKVVIK